MIHFEHNIIATCTCFHLMFNKSSAQLSIKLFPFYYPTLSFSLLCLCAPVASLFLLVLFFFSLLNVNENGTFGFSTEFRWSVNLKSVYLIGSAFSNNTKKGHFDEPFMQLAMPMPMPTLYANRLHLTDAIDFLHLYRFIYCPRSGSLDLSGCVLLIFYSYHLNCYAKIKFCFHA